MRINFGLGLNIDKNIPPSRMPVAIGKIIVDLLNVKEPQTFSYCDHANNYGINTL